MEKLKGLINGLIEQFGLNTTEGQDFLGYATNRVEFEEEINFDKIENDKVAAALREFVGRLTESCAA